MCAARGSAFDCAGPVFYEIQDVVHLPRWMTRFASKHTKPKNPKPLILKLKPRSNMKP